MTHESETRRRETDRAWHSRFEERKADAPRPPADRPSGDDMDPGELLRIMDDHQEPDFDPKVTHMAYPVAARTAEAALRELMPDVREDFPDAAEWSLTDDEGNELIEADDGYDAVLQLATLWGQAVDREVAQRARNAELEAKLAASEALADSRRVSAAEFVEMREERDDALSLLGVAECARDEYRASLNGVCHERDTAVQRVAALTATVERMERERSEMEAVYETAAWSETNVQLARICKAERDTALAQVAALTALAREGIERLASDQEQRAQGKIPSNPSIAARVLSSRLSALTGDADATSKEEGGA